MGEVKERNCGKNPSSAICEANADIIVMYALARRLKNHFSEENASQLFLAKIYVTAIFKFSSFPCKVLFYLPFRWKLTFTCLVTCFRSRGCPRRRELHMLPKFPIRGLPSVTRSDVKYPSWRCLVEAGKY